MRWSVLSAVAFCGLCGAGSTTAQAQALDSWQFEATVYAYLPTVGGSTSFPASSGGSSASIDADKILDSLNMAFMGSLEARRGRFGLFTDVLYVDLGDTKSGSRSLSLGGVTLPAGVNAKLGLDLKGWVWTLGGVYEVAKTPTSQFDVIGGARMLDIEQQLDWTLTGNVGSIALQDRGAKRTADLQNWDLIVGVKGKLTFGQSGKWYAPYYLDVGTGESDLTWQAMAGVGYSFGWGDVVGSWRHLDYEMSSGKAIESLNFSGPVVAAVWRW